MEESGLAWALQCGDMEVVKKLLVTTEDVNRPVEGGSGRSPLHYAADFGQKDVLEFLVSKGADVNASDRHGLTPLMYACYENHVSCVKFLLEKGADKHRKAPDGLCPLESSESDAIKALLK